MKFILAKKIGMTQLFDGEGNAHPVTLVSAGPVVVTQIKEPARDGYKAVQIGFGVRHKKNISKPEQGHLKDRGNFRYLKEFRLSDSESYAVGDTIDASVFAEGDSVEVSAVSKGKGFQGVVARHGFHGGPRSHGQKHSEREPGSIGGGLRTRVPKGMRMAGRVGGNTVTVKNLRVLKVEPETRLMMIEGAVPGRRGALVTIRGH
ncbi:MAG: 50S ribosomal protein L3 [bacterium]|nr:50S ribosomal protein L3 [bacterium]